MSFKTIKSMHFTKCFNFNSLLDIISGIRRDVARFSQLSGLMFQFNLDSHTWVQMKLPERPKHQRYRP